MISITLSLIGYLFGLVIVEGLSAAYAPPSQERHLQKENTMWSVGIMYKLSLQIIFEILNNFYNIR